MIDIMLLVLLAVICGYVCDTYLRLSENYQVAYCNNYERVLGGVSYIINVFVTVNALVRTYMINNCKFGDYFY